MITALDPNDMLTKNKIKSQVYDIQEGFSKDPFTKPL